MTMRYSEAIKKLRKKMLVTQSELANILGVSFASVNRWENEEHEPTMKIKRTYIPSHTVFPSLLFSH